MTETEEHYDVVILGTGPAGLQSAIHASRRKASVAVLGKIKKSSAFQAHIENYCCVSGSNGEEMLQQGRNRAQESGAVFLDEDVTDLQLRQEGGFLVHTESGRTVRAEAVVLAMGVARNKLNVPGEKELVGRGVSYCVDCDAGFFKNEPVAMAGCESAAASGALTLLFYASEVHMICRELDVAGSLGQRLHDSAVRIHEGRFVREIVGDTSVEAVVLDDGTRLEVAGVFIELGAKGAVDLAAGIGVKLDDEHMKYIDVSKKQETNVPGVFAAGDICGPPWQVAKAVGEGCVAGLEAASYARKRKG
jgi:thioredoxin reductase (NADPH)